jgi:nucleoside-diphosphate-sugar epimerase
MNILVTGGLGFIGHNVVAKLESLGHRVVVMDNLTDYGVIPKQELDSLIHERLQRIQNKTIWSNDINHAFSVDMAFRTCQPDVVVHLASFPRQKIVNSDPAWGSRTMSEGLLNLLEASCKHHVKRFVYVSSSMVYGNFEANLSGGINEDHVTRPIGQYSIMKLAGEWLVKDYAARTDMKYTILRPSAVYGPRDVEDRVVSRFLLTAMRGGVLQVNGSDEYLDFTHIDDASTGIVQAVSSDRAANNTYNIARGHSHSLLDVANLTVAIAGQGTVQVCDKDKNFPSRGTLDIALARRDFGFDPRINVEQGLEQYWHWLNNHIYYSNTRKGKND